MDLVYWMWLANIPYIGPVTANKLLSIFTTPKEIYELDEEALRKIEILNKRQMESLIENRQLKQAESIIKQCRLNEISIITCADGCYPDRAKKFNDSPIILYYKGKIKNLDKTIGIVGARRCTQQTKKIVQSVANEYVKKGYTIISGMAKGVDSYAHTVALNNNAYTIAIVGNGLDMCYPCEHDKLMNAIEDNGLLLSEYPPGTKPTRYTFPRRNRIISAWADELLVIAAGKGSGALITAEYSSNYGRSVLYIK